ncbi:type II toxin-antitoxin system VapC family toxin [Paraoerskovia marina]|uniref:type II toxin-antitoxin system VapC family toxin n=1 Tax=Paraoerskovia marina TaxID=545619 RepID=UPI000492B817|nr:type II toxin-antitoxin system VapC family toxin [Paraoerskovia marina]
MIVDTSAIVAVLLDEPAAPAIAELLLTETSAMSAATLVELGAVVGGRLPPQQRRRLDALMELWEIEIVPCDAVQAEIARAAYRDFGRGSGHAARLNLGDCYAYALASDRGEPLLFVGDDFSHTDLTPALVG